jgi:hypothetical protein
MKNHRTYGRCKVTDKVCHGSRKDAKHEINKILLRDKTHPTLNAFKCDHCGYFHVGTKTMDGEFRTREDHRNANHKYFK